MAYIESELLRTLPRVLRARDFRLYLEGSKRLVDLWLAGGRAVLGHKPPKVLSEMKNAAERGLFTALPHPAEKRFFKALSEFFPDRAFRLYTNSGSLCQALSEAGFPSPNKTALVDPAFGTGGNAGSDGPGSVSLWRPFLEPSAGVGGSPEAESRKASVVIPVLPWPLGPEVLVLDKNIEDSFPKGELIPPVLLAPAARALYTLIAVMKAKAKGQNYPRYHKIEKTLKNQANWRRRGIYLTFEPHTDREKYAALFQRFLEGGFLIPPCVNEPVILPMSMSPGEESKLAGLLEQDI